MRKPILHIITVIIILIIGFYTLDNYIQDKEQSGSILDYKNAEYVIDGRNIKLESGVSEIQSATSSESKIVTKYFGNEIKKDYSMRVYTKEEFIDLCKQVGFMSFEAYGDWGKTPYSEDSEDMIIVAKK